MGLPSIPAKNTGVTAQVWNENVWLTPKWFGRTRRICPRWEDIAMPMIFSAFGPGDNLNWNYRLNKDNVNQARYVLENKCTCFCRPDAPGTRWTGWMDVVNWMCKQGPYSGRVGEALPIGDCAGLWTNRPPRHPDGPLYGAILDTQPDYPEIVQELIAVCQVMMTCSGSKPILLGYRSCKNHDLIVWTMAPSGFRDKLVFCSSPGPGAVSGFFCNTPGFLEIGYFDWMIPDELTPFSLVALRNAAPTNIKLFGRACFYLDRIARCDGIHDSRIVIVNTGELNDWTQYYADFCPIGDLGVIVPPEIPYTEVSGYDPSISFCDEEECQDCKVWYYVRCGVSETRASLKDKLWYPKRDGDPPPVIIPRSEDKSPFATDTDNQCFYFVREENCSTSAIASTWDAEVESCDDIRCGCCPKLDLDMMDLISQAIIERVEWAGGTISAESVLRQSAKDTKATCTLQKAFWLSICAEWDAQLQNLYAQIYCVWLNSDVHTEGNLEGAASPTYFIASDFTSGDPGSGVETCKRLKEWAENTIPMIVRLRAVVVAGTKDDMSFQERTVYASSTSSCDAAKAAIPGLWSGRPWVEDSWPHCVGIGTHEVSWRYGSQYYAEAARVRGNVTINLSSFSSGSAQLYVTAGYGAVDAGDIAPIACSVGNGPIPTDNKYHLAPSDFPVPEIGVSATAMVNSDENSPVITGDCVDVGGPNANDISGTIWAYGNILAVVQGDFLL